MGKRTQILLEADSKIIATASLSLKCYAALHPFLYVHKSTTQGFLDLFQAYFNLRKRRWGRHKGSCAYEQLTGQPVGDWLSELGFAPA